VAMVAEFRHGLSYRLPRLIWLIPTEFQVCKYKRPTFSPCLGTSLAEPASGVLAGGSLWVASIWIRQHSVHSGINAMDTGVPSLHTVLLTNLLFVLRISMCLDCGGWRF
jgi:hypothetical protein